MPTATSAQVAASPLPSKIGEWRLLRQLNASARFQVYQAAPLQSDGACADYVLKTLSPAATPDTTSLQMLRREAAVSNSVSHPNLTTVLASELERPPYYVVTPFTVGATLQQSIDRGGPLRTPHALWIARQVAAALAALHRSGWGHADVKPANILLAPSGHTTLIDLGVACRWPLPCGGWYFAGTPSYAAPEWFVTSCIPGPASDLYCLGAVLFEMLTGRSWCEAAGGPEKLGSRSFCDPRQFVANISLPVVQLLRRLLATEPLRRPAAAELVDELRRLEIDTLDEWG